MSHISATTYGDGVAVSYSPAIQPDGRCPYPIPAKVHVRLDSRDGDACLSLSIADARKLLAQLPDVLDKHYEAESDIDRFPVDNPAPAAQSVVA